MLINIRISELVTETRNSVPLVIIVTLIYENAYDIIFSENYLNNSLMNFNGNLFNYITYYNWENNLTEFTHIMAIGNIMYTSYSILLILISLILLLSMVGAIIITIKQKTVISEQKS
jgi:NADH-ubiquinone oxidoreductase chain 6